MSTYYAPDRFVTGGKATFEILVNDKKRDLASTLAQWIFDSSDVVFTTVFLNTHPGVANRVISDYRDSGWNIGIVYAIDYAKGQERLNKEVAVCAPDCDLQEVERRLADRNYRVDWLGKYDPGLVQPINIESMKTIGLLLQSLIEEFKSTNTIQEDAELLKLCSDASDLAQKIEKKLAFAREVSVDEPEKENKAE